MGMRTRQTRNSSLGLLSLLAFGTLSGMLLSGSPAHAQANGAAGQVAGQTAAPADTASPGLITSPTYQISVDDTMEISVSTLGGFGPVVKSVQFTVLSDGTADIPYLGETKVTGMTIADLKAKIRKAVAKNLTRPEVSVAVRGRYQKMVNIFGPMTTKGKLPLRDNWRVRDVIAAAGGLPTDRYDFLEATLLKNKTGEVVPIDLQRLFVDKDPAQNYVIDAEDTIFIREIDQAQTQVQVIGEVLHPGPVLLPRSHSIIDVLQAAGGPSTAAALTEARIERGGKNIPVNLLDYRKTGFDPPEKLEMGDRLVIPENKKEYYLYGNVARGGTQIYPEDRKLTVSQVIALSGGQVQGAEIKKTRLIRKNADGTTKTTQVVNVEKMLKTGDLTGDPVIEPGDSIYVPPAGHRQGYGLQEIVAMVGGVSALLFYLHRR